MARLIQGEHFAMSIGVCACANWASSEDLQEPKKSYIINRDSPGMRTIKDTFMGIPRPRISSFKKVDGKETINMAKFIPRLMLDAFATTPYRVPPWVYLVLVSNFVIALIFNTVIVLFHLGLIWRLPGEKGNPQNQPQWNDTILDSHRSRIDGALMRTFTIMLPLLTTLALFFFPPLIAVC